MVADRLKGDPLEFLKMSTGGAGTRTPPTLVLVDLLLLSVLLLPLDAVALLADWACCCFFFFRGMMMVVRWLDSVVVIVVVIVG